MEECCCHRMIEERIFGVDTLCVCALTTVVDMALCTDVYSTFCYWLKHLPKSLLQSELFFK